MKKAFLYFRLMRPEQWLKNGLIFLPLFFHQELGAGERMRTVLLVFIGFSLLASSVYCFNDVHDVEADRLHPQKRERPLAKGSITLTGAVRMIVGLGIAGLGIAWLGTHMVSVVALFAFYFLLNIGYTLWFKHYSIVDVLIIATGFVIRVLLGGIACHIPLSHWIILMTFLLALFMAFAKRRDDVIFYEKTGVKLRRNVVGYNVEFLNVVLSVLATITIVAYIMYTVSPEVIARIGDEYLYLTSFFVIAGMLRYLQITFVEMKSGDPTQIFYKDRFIQGSVIGWVLLFGYFIYF